MSSMTPKLIGLFLVLYEVEYFLSRLAIHTLSVWIAKRHLA